MPVGLGELTELKPVAGVRLASVAAGIRYKARNDLTLFELAEGSSVAGVFTKNAFCAAPVVVARKHMQSAPVRALLVNSGNANAGTGQHGMDDANACCRYVADALDCSPEQVLPFSTGVIGERLPLEKFRQAVPVAAEKLLQDGWTDAAHAIMTTDIVPKGFSRQIDIDGRTVTITGIAKGSGMIRPDMATMLCYIATDAAIEQSILQEMLSAAVTASFNRITVDGDTSTNDACMLVATGKSGVNIDAGSEAWVTVSDAVAEACLFLAQAIIRDAEGATKFITLDVDGGRDEQECLDVAYTIAHSPLVKTALFASDPNWGRILAAVGRAGIEDMVLEDVKLFLDDVCIVENGGRADSYTEEAGQSVMNREEITIRVELGRGDAAATVWTSDLSHDYVKINAEYRS